MEALTLCYIHSLPNQLRSVTLSDIGFWTIFWWVLRKIPTYTCTHAVHTLTPLVSAGAYLEISEGHKLDDVSWGDITSGWTQQFVITVKELHSTEVCLAHTHYDDRHGQTRGLYDSSACLVHVCDHSICDDEQHKVLLQMERENNVRYKVNKVVSIWSCNIILFLFCLSKTLYWLKH